MKIIAFAGSNSKKSINHQLVQFVASLQENIEVIKLSEFDVPMYSMDIEEVEGIPNGVKSLASKLEEADAYVISVSEHNGNVSAFFKNNIDWLSRNDRNFLENKKILLLSTSPGGGGAKSALKITEGTLPYFKGEVVQSVSLGSFYDNFIDGKLISEEMKNEIEAGLAKLG